MNGFKLKSFGQNFFVLLIDFLVYVKSSMFERSKGLLQKNHFLPNVSSISILSTFGPVLTEKFSLGCDHGKP